MKPTVSVTIDNSTFLDIGTDHITNYDNNYDQIIKYIYCSVIE